MKQIIKGAIFYATVHPIRDDKHKYYMPVLVIQSNNCNQLNETTMVAQIATRCYKGKILPIHVAVKQFRKLRPNSIILLDHIFTIEKTELIGYVGMLNSNQMREVEKAIQTSMGFFDKYPGTNDKIGVKKV